ncbi:MAG: zinc-binding protein [Desulfobulbaceae bacterium]|nr:MAG: zinc-binding protein [Desulfobulbaceae bacterium]
MIPIQSGCSCACSSGPKLILTCSGSVEVGIQTDQAARKLTRIGSGWMICLAGVSGWIGGILKSAQTATSIPAIDDCALDCARKSLEEAGFKRINHLRLTDLRLEKGSTEIDDDSIAQVVDKAKIFLS